MQIMQVFTSFYKYFFDIYIYIVYIYVHPFLLRPKKKICVFTVTRPTLIFASDPINFYTEFG